MVITLIRAQNDQKKYIYYRNFHFRISIPGTTRLSYSIYARAKPQTQQIDKLGFRECRNAYHLELAISVIEFFCRKLNGADSDTKLGKKRFEEDSGRF